MNDIYKNYHKHDYYGNPWMMDVVVSPEDYCKRAVELGHDTVFTVNHGVTGNIFEWMEKSKKYNLKMCYGTEAYYVADRFEKDNSNKHLIIIAKNNEGVMQLNDIMSEAHTTGFYRKPRIDRQLLFSLNPKNFIITTACVAGIWDDSELILALYRKFRDNFFLEIQNHNFALQKTINQKMLKLHEQVGIPIIHANDSHYIYPEDSKYRDILLKAKGFKYDHEDEMCLDYPEYDEILNRYDKQGIVKSSLAKSALDKTNVFDECEPITLINDDIKLPQVSETPTEDLREIINQQWQIEKENVPKERWKEYTDAIKYELDVVEKTHMENYFLIDYIVAKNGQAKYDGRLTNTGRGSAPSFYITKLLGLTDIDRIASPITLFPHRFMSVERILGARSLPDIDLNTTDRVPFIKATEDLLGAENCAWMVAWNPLQAAKAFRLYCKGIGLDFKDYDEVAKNLAAYEHDKKWKNIIQESKRFIGVIESISESPCSMLLYYKPVRQELGLIRTNSKDSPKICCLLDGYNCDKYKYLKNDYLTVTVWAIIREVCKAANIPIPTIREFNELLDDKTFDIYKNGLTCTINQADSDFATGLVKRYKPKSVSEMSAFVAIIRPGCASLLQDFIDRKDYSTGVKELDELLTEGNNRMIYQELIMKYLIWLGVKETGSYDIIKKISKKKFKEPELKALKQQLLEGWNNRVGNPDNFEGTWTVVEQAAHYSFNASHSLSYAYDSLYGAYLKSHYPLEYYTIALNFYGDDEKRTLRLTKELDYWGIKLRPIKFRYSKGDYALSRTDYSIYKGIQSIKGMNAKVADELYEFRDNNYSTFFDLLFDIKDKTSATKAQLKCLIELDYFSEFGDINLLLKQTEFFNKFVGKKQFKKDALATFNLGADDIKPYAARETQTMFTDVNFREFANSVANKLNFSPRKLSEDIKAQKEYLGYLTIRDDRYSGMAVVLEIDTKYSPRCKMYSLKNGTTIDCKISKPLFKKCVLEEGDIVTISSTTKKPKQRKNELGKWESIPNTSELWISRYQKISSL